MDLKRFPALIVNIYEIVTELENMFPGRKFTPDGHMVGSIGEALAAYYYGIELLPLSAECHDGKCGDRMIQIKATQGAYIGIRSEPEHLLVLKLDRTGAFKEVFNGPGSLVWDLVRSKAFPKNGQHKILLSTLAKIMAGVATERRLPRIRNNSNS